MMPANTLIDCMLYIASVGAPNLKFLCEGGTELASRTLSVRNFQHPNRLLKLIIVLKTYFKNSHFIGSDDVEWKTFAEPLFEVYKKVYLEVISPVLRTQFEGMRMSWFNPRIFAENLSYVCFLNQVFYERENLKDIILQTEGLLRYHCLWYVFYLRAQKMGETELEIESGQDQDVKFLNGQSCTQNPN